ncbi:ribokinase RbsK [Gottschalkia purinilytica]|uniref:Ribokinase n=1 Tax=Gottschalkia purinilytica TaxID=1503 RepID=A0A0L0WE43_GOTPU|nr:ribokinase [Gottschalkia purinilytica]KNF09739.1 ribokinase RbsK [Gottschalkia purinilytica]
MNKVTILGSLNMDLVVAVKNIPVVGETVLATNFNKIPGGKGANQAVASARLGAKVSMIGKVGDDEHGTILLENLKKDHIDYSYVFKDEVNPTGTAVISVDSKGNNSIIVISGSNMELNIDEVRKYKSVIEESDVIISQFEVPMDAIIEGFKIAKENGVITLLNPAPAKEISDELMKLTDIIVPNETEAFSITGVNIDSVESAKLAGIKLLEKGVKHVIITLGEKGAVLVSNDGCEIIPALKVDAIDTTAAGDSFIGALSTKLRKEDSLTHDLLKEAIPFANKVSSIVVTREGAQPSIPYLNEVE